MDDFLLDDASGHIAASRNKSYRKRTREYFRVLVAFFQDNKLTTRDLVDPEDPQYDTVKIMKSDLTDEGFLLFKNGVDRWTRGHDRGRPIEDTSILEKALNKLRE